MQRHQGLQRMCSGFHKRCGIVADDRGIANVDQRPRAFHAGRVELVLLRHAVHVIEDPSAQNAIVTNIEEKTIQRIGGRRWVHIELES